MPDHAKTLATYDHPFFGQWPAITENQYGSGTLLYEGTYLSDALQQDVLLDTLRRIGLTGPDQQLPAAIHAVHGTNRNNARIDYYFNYSAAPVTFMWQEAPGTDLLTGHTLATGQSATIQPWDLLLIEEK
jgi:beta-galactosidase